MPVMQFDLTQDFPVGLDRLWSILGRADYIEAKYRSLGSTSLRLLKFKVDPRSIDVEVDREVPVARGQLPLWARVFIGERLTMHHSTHWRRNAADRVDTELDIDAPGLPVRAKGTGSVAQLTSAHSRMMLRFDVTSRSVALKSVVARLFAQQVQRALEADHAFTLDYLRARSRH